MKFKFVDTYPKRKVQDIVHYRKNKKYKINFKKRGEKIWNLKLHLIWFKI